EHDDSACIPIVYGNVSTPLKNIPDFATTNPDFTHRWTLYVRGLDPHADMSPFISKVIFKLHDSFAMPLRSVEKWPFEISELGWGEFEVQIKIFLKDSISKPLQLVHFLRLYPSEENGILLPIPPPSPLISVIAESYNEIVICSPSLKSVMKRAGIGNICTLSKLEKTSSPYPTVAKQELERLTATKNAIQTEISQVIEKRQALAKLLSK
ncbi:YEATS domain-containing protein 4, partial [Mitosporidium daphniae]